MGSSKRKLDTSDSRHKKKSKKRPTSDVEDAGIKYLGHAGREVKVVLGKNSSPGDINVNIYKNQRVTKISTIEREARRKRAKERERKRKQHEPSMEKREKLQKKAAKKAQKRLEKRIQKRRRKYVTQTGNDISLDEFKNLEKIEKEQMVQRGKEQLEANSGMAPISAYFLPIDKEGEQANMAASNESEINTAAELLHRVMIQDSEERTEAILPFESLSEEHNNMAEKESMYLRLAFLDRDKVDEMKHTPATDFIRKTELIGPVLIEKVVGQNIAKIEPSEFMKLSDYNLRKAGRTVGVKKFKSLKDCLSDADWKVHMKYLSKRNRQGDNNAWTPEQVRLIVDAVEGGKNTFMEKSKKRSFNEAASYLRHTLGKKEGFRWDTINKERVKYVYRNKDKLLCPSTRSKQGRPAFLSPECLKGIEKFVNETLDGKISYRLVYYRDHLDKILEDFKEDEYFYDACKDTDKYLRTFIQKIGGAPREVTTYGGKDLSDEERLLNTEDTFQRLAFLVQKYGLEKKDVYNFDETAVRFHEDATGKVIARKGRKIIRGEAFEGSLDHRLCCTFIPMVNCAGEKFDPAFIFKGTNKQTGAIPGNKDGFKKWQELYDKEGENKICFMQNQGKWSTNDTMAQWFKEHFIPRVQLEKERRRSQGEIVSDKYVVILDGVSTHCLSKSSGTKSWIIEVQEHDPDLILFWLPPNMTGDLQPLDVNFNRPFKSKFRSILARLKKKRRDAEESNTEVNNTPRENSAAYKLKDVVIEGMINTYKVIPKMQIEKGWTKAGKYVYEDNDKPHEGLGYHLAWETVTQNSAMTRYTTGRIFHEGMAGGISDIEGKLRFIPMAGRKKNQATEEQEEQSAEDEEESDVETQQFSEYGSSQCPDEFIDEETPDDMIVDPMSD